MKCVCVCVCVYVCVCVFAYFIIGMPDHELALGCLTCLPQGLRLIVNYKTVTCTTELSCVCCDTR